jgi:Adenylate and Guanylate cyclase catalytic domain
MNALLEQRRTLRPIEYVTLDRHLHLVIRSPGSQRFADQAVALVRGCDGFLPFPALVGAIFGAIPSILPVAGSRRESQGVAGQIQVTAATYGALRDHDAFEHRGYSPIKGRGTRDTDVLVGRTARGLTL